MADEKPLTEQEKRYLNALKLFMERSEDPSHHESATMLDEFSPEQARAMIASYHLLLEDPQAFYVAHKISGWISPIFHPWVYIVNYIRRRKHK
jgi:hypothetical protein